MSNKFDTREEAHAHAMTLPGEKTIRRAGDQWEVVQRSQPDNDTAGAEQEEVADDEETESED